MPPDRRLAIHALCGIVFMLSAATAQALDIKPGEWEQTVSFGMSGAPPIPPEALAKMPPEARKKLQAQLENVRTSTSRSCLTVDEIARFDKDGLGGDQDQKTHCTRQLKSNTARRTEYRVECVREQSTMHSDIVISSPDPERYSMVSTNTGTIGGKASQSKIEIQGRWLGSACSKPAR